MPAKIDITNQRFGKLVAVRRLDNGKWLCKCDCGGEIEYEAGKLRTGKFKSCGCLRHKTLPDDLTGMRFGKLVAIKKEDESVSKNNEKWICQCDCGNTKSIYRSNLFQGATISCGCVSIENSIDHLQLVENTSLIAITNKPNKSNTSGVVGVVYLKKRDKWRAVIYFQKKTKYLGEFYNKEDAIRARKKAEIERDKWVKEHIKQ